MTGYVLQGGLSVRFTCGVLFTLVLSAGLSANAREWKAREGSFKVEAELVQLRSGKVYLELASDGRVLPVPVEKLSFDDYDYLRTVTRPEIREYLKKNPLPSRGMVFQMKLEGTSEQVRFLDFSPKGDLLAVASDTGIALYDTKTWKQVAFQKSNSSHQFRFCKFSPSGKGMIAGGITSELAIYSLIGGKLVEQKKMPRIHTYQIGSAAFSPDGQHVLTTDKAGHSVYWNQNTAEIVHKLKSDEFGSGGISYINPKGTQGLCGNGSALVLYDLKSGEAIQKLKIGTSSGKMSLGPAGRMFIISQAKGTELKDIVTGKVHGSIKDLRNKPVLFSPSGKFVVAADYKKVSVLGMPGLKPLATFHPPETFSERFLAISRDDKFLATAHRGFLSVFSMPQAN